eukprot:NODE_19_length_39463_cov_0.396073.p16 type:complete len:223 gc:universal NODE_19_length_39463_cov_0.396073:15221-14553(-)
MFNKLHNFKYVPKALKISVMVVIILLINRNQEILNKYMVSLPTISYPTLDQVYTFRMDFKLVWTVITIVYCAIYLAGVKLASRDMQQSGDEERNDLPKSLERADSARSSQCTTVSEQSIKDRHFSRKKVSYYGIRAVLFTEFAFLMVWVGSSQGYLFPIKDDNNVISIRGIVCKAAYDNSVKHQRVWKEACSISNWLIVCGYIICLLFLLTFSCKTIKLYKK